MCPHTTGFGLRALRLTRFVLHILRAVLIAACVFPWLERPARRHRLQQWSAQLLGILAVRRHVTGAAQYGGAALLVANHVSWLDIFAINAVRPTRFVAKSEIRGWPLIGWLCARGDTLFIHRNRRHHTREINQAMATALTAGESFAVFPEGTTTHGDVLLPFHTSLLQPALVAGVGILPVAIRYTRADGSLCTEADYEGDKNLFQSLLQLLTQPEVEVRLQFLPAMASAGMDRRGLADAAAADIATALGLAAPSRRAGSARGPTASVR